MEELWNLLWSGRQQAFHIERLTDTMEKNVKVFLSSFSGRHSSDYITLYVGTFDDCHKVADGLRPKLIEQQRLKSAAAGVIDAISGQA